MPKSHIGFSLRSSSIAMPILSNADERFMFYVTCWEFKVVFDLPSIALSAKSECVDWRAFARVPLTRTLTQICCASFLSFELHGVDITRWIDSVCTSVGSLRSCILGFGKRRFVYVHRECCKYDWRVGSNNLIRGDSRFVVQCAGFVSSLLKTRTSFDSHKKQKLNPAIPWFAREKLGNIQCFDRKAVLDWGP